MERAGGHMSSCSLKVAIAVQGKLHLQLKVAPIALRTDIVDHSKKRGCRDRC